MRTLAALLSLAALLAAGCISPDQAPTNGSATPAAPTPADRIDGMTAEAQKTDKAVDCSNGGTEVPPRYCAERNLTVTGRIGVASLPVSLTGTNGGITVRAGEGDAWSFHAVVRVSAPTQDMANQALDTAWTWSHESDGRHAFRAGPAQAPVATPAPLPVGAPVGAAQVVSTRYELVLPAWVVLDSVSAQGDNGGVLVTGFRAGKADLSTTNGGVSFLGSAEAVSLSTTNGGATLDLTPTATGSVSVTTTNGGVTATIHRALGLGVDLDAKSTNGAVTLNLSGGQLTTNERAHKHFRSDGFDGAAIQTTMTLGTTNGGIVATDG